jgi:hypothetical protein
VRAHVDEDAVTENLTQVLLASPVVCDIAGEVERLPVLDSIMVDFSGDFVPRLSDESIDVSCS